MKKFSLFLIMTILIFLSCSCAAGFSFRDHRFGDTADQIINIEGDPDDTITDIEGWESIVYPNVEIWDDYEARLIYSFNDDELKHIIAVGSFGYRVDVADAAEKLNAKLKLGEPTEESGQNSCCKAFWSMDGYAAALVITPESFTLVYGEDMARVEAYYDSLTLSSLYEMITGTEPTGS